MNKISIISAAMLAGLSLASAPAFSAISTFDTDRDGWTVEGDTTSSLNWSSVGGNPDGHVWISDLAIGPDVYFLAPSKFLGDQSSTLGSKLSYDLKWEYPLTDSLNPYYAPDVILSGNGLTAVFAHASNPIDSNWNSYSIPLIASSWKLNSLSGSTVSDSDFASILANLTNLKIRGEFRYGPETAYLDNVNMTSVPVPPAFILFATGLMSWFGNSKRKRNA